jgi:hypothetical protein
MLNPIKDLPEERALCVFKLKTGYFMLGYLVIQAHNKKFVKQYGGEKLFQPLRDTTEYQYVLQSDGSRTHVKINLTTTIEEV